MQKSLHTQYLSIQDSIDGDQEKPVDARKNTLNIRFLEHYREYARHIEECLNTQRMRAMGEGLKRLRHDTDHKRHETMEKQGPSVFYYAQRAFSLPYDYMVKPEDFGKKKSIYIQSLVFQPELINDDFLIDLGIMNPKDRLPALTRLSEHEKASLRTINIERKIAVIPKLKDILSKSRSIQTGIQNRASGRILAIQDGRYIVFSEHKTPGEQKNRPKISYTPHVYEDMYALLRSIGYGRANLSTKLGIIPTIKSELDALYTSWNTMGLEEKKKAIAGIFNQIQSYQSPHIARARDRLIGVEYHNSVHDNGRVFGAANDLGKYILTHEGKRSAFSHQHNLVHHLIGSEEAKFLRLRTSFIEHIGRLDSTEIMSYIDSRGQGVLSSETKRKIIDALRAIHTFQSESRRTGFIGRPFSSYVSELSIIIEGVYEKDSLEQIRILFKIVLYIKKFSFILTLYKIKHAIRLNNTASKDMLLEVENTLLLLCNKNFLPLLELREVGKKKFEDMIKELLSIKQLLEEENYEKILNTISNMGI